MASTTVSAALMALLTSTALAQQFVQYSGSDRTYSYQGNKVSSADDPSVERFDAILSPGTISQHVHQVFGASGMDPSMSYDSLQQSSCTNVGSAKGIYNSQDLSVYWHPALYMEANDGSGYVRIPSLGHKLYYQDRGSKKDQKRVPFEFPAGFRMIAGDPFMRQASTDIHQQNITQWICHGTEGNPGEYGSNQGPGGGFPTNVEHCAAYPFFNGAIHFPHCWNGQDFDQKNPKAHVSYPDGDISNGDCPSTHPIRLPHLFIENSFDVESMIKYTKPNTFALAQGDPTGFGWHMDFYNGWQAGALSNLLTDSGCSQGQYGNEDIGLCSAFKPGPSKSSDCSLKTTFVEKVDTPGPLLPGCNPVVKDQNPSPMFAVAPINVYSDVCSIVGGVGGAVSSIASGLGGAATSILSNVFGGSPATSTAASVATTLATSIKTSAAATTYAASSPASYAESTSASNSSDLCPSQNGQSFTDKVSGKSFVIECGVDHAAGDLSMKQISVHGDLSDCIAACAATAGCVDVSLSGVACYMKSSIGAAENNAGVQGARLVGAPSGTSSATAPSTTTAPTAAAEAGKNVLVVTASEVAYVTETRTATAYAPNNHARHAHAQMHARAAGVHGAKYHVGNLAF